MRILVPLMFALATAIAPSSFAADPHAHAAGPATYDGEVRKIDRDAKKLTIKHGPLKELDMPAMTMVYQIKDPAQLDRLKEGDKVRFEAQKLGGAYIVTRIEAAK